MRSVELWGFRWAVEVAVAQYLKRRDWFCPKSCRTLERNMAVSVFCGAQVCFKYEKRAFNVFEKLCTREDPRELML